MKLFIRKSGGGSRNVLAGLIAAASFALAAGSLHSAQIINPSNNPTTVANTDSPRSAQLPWVAEVTKMADAGVAPDVMEAYVKNTPSYSTLSVDDILYLKSRGVADNVVAAMIQHGASGQQAAAAAAASQYAPPPQYYAAAPAQSYYPAQDYDQDQSSTYVIPQYYPNYYYSYPYYPYYSPYIFWNFGFNSRFRNFDRFHFGGPGFRGGFGRPGFRGGFGGRPVGGGRAPFTPVGGFHGGGMAMHGGGMGGGFRR